MRYTVKIPDPDRYQEVESTLRENQVRIYATSPRRGLLSTDPPPEELVSFIHARGGSVSLDSPQQFE